jgi:CBS domain-containing protein
MEKEYDLMKVQDVMTKEVSFCDPGTNAGVAAEIMWTKNCGALLVVEDGRVAGIVTDRDLFIALGTNSRSAGDLQVGALMGREVSFCAPGDDVRTALQTMAQRRVQRLPVVDAAGSLKGILSIEDIALRTGTDGLSNEDVLTTMNAIWDRQVQHRTREVGRSVPRRAAA